VAFVQCRSCGGVTHKRFYKIIWIFDNNYRQSLTAEQAKTTDVLIQIMSDFISRSNDYFVGFACRTGLYCLRFAFAYSFDLKMK